MYAKQAKRYARANNSRGTSGERENNINLTNNSDLLKQAHLSYVDGQKGTRASLACKAPSMADAKQF